MDEAFDETSVRRSTRGLAPGSEIGGYRIGARLGSGGMGAVYSAYDGGNNLVAIKFLHAHLDADSRGRERLRREAVALQRLRHPSVAQILDVELDGSEAFIVTELVDGPTLEDEIAARGALDPWDLYELAEQLAAALEAVHGAGVVHRDLKPSNVLIAARGPVLIDFGLAQGGDDPRVTSTGLIMGTPGYLAPELLTGAPPSGDTDWWGWAAVLAYAATGRAPFGVTPTEAVLARARSGLPDLAGLGPTTAGALAAGLRADPTRRIGPTEVVGALRRAADEGDVGSQPTVIIGPPTDPTQIVVPVVAPPLPISQRAVRDGRTTVVPMSATSPAPVFPPVGVQAAEPAGPVPGGDLLEELGAPPLVEEPEPGYKRPVLARRRSVLAALGLPLVLLGIAYPGVAAILAAVLVVGARIVGVSTDSLHGRRERRGVGAHDTARGVLVFPWHVVRALVGSLPSILVAGCAAVLVVVGAWWFLDTVTVDTGTADLVYSTSLGVAAVATVALLWTGPLSYLTRYGARTTLARAAPPPVGTLVFVSLGVLLTGVLVALLVTGHETVWAPLPEPPRMD